MIPFIDIHCHLDYKGLKENIDQIVKNAKEAGVTISVSNGLNPESNRAVLALAKKHPEIKAALGFYPPTKKEEQHFSWDDFEKELEFIKENQEDIIAIGEIGMDGKENSDFSLQEKIFTNMIQLAKELDKPMLIHSRKAEKEVLEILEREQAKKVILHCFSGKKTLIKKGRDLGYSFSIPTNVVRAENFQILADLVPINQLFCETDAPFLSPFKDKSNQPAYVVESYKKIAEIKNRDLEEVKNNIFLNYQRLFL